MDDWQDDDFWLLRQSLDDLGFCRGSDARSCHPDPEGHRKGARLLVAGFDCCPNPGTRSSVDVLSRRRYDCPGARTLPDDTIRLQGTHWIGFDRLGCGFVR